MKTDIIATLIRVCSHIVSVNHSDMTIHADIIIWWLAQQKQLMNLDRDAEKLTKIIPQEIDTLSILTKSTRYYCDDPAGHRSGCRAIIDRSSCCFLPQASVSGDFYFAGSKTAISKLIIQSFIP